MPLKVKAKEQMQKIGTYAGKYRYVMMPERMATRTQARMVVRAQEITAAATPTHPEATWTSMKDKKEIWKFAIQTAISILSAIATALGVTSCMA